MSLSSYTLRLLTLLSFLFCSFLWQPLGATTDHFSQDLGQMVEESPVFNRGFTGFVLYDPETQEYLYQKDADKYFTPASNTKILTLYTALQILKDSMPILHYRKMHLPDRAGLVIWGAGNPLFLHPDFASDDRVVNFLKSYPGPLFLSDHNYRDHHYGKGWMWDDFPYYFQPEKSGLPLYGNVVRFQRKADWTGFRVYPDFFYDHLLFDPKLPDSRAIVHRKEQENLFSYNGEAVMGGGFKKEIPFKYHLQLAASLLADTLDMPVNVYNFTQKPIAPYQTLSVAIQDTLFRRLMFQSDNFIAEQLLLTCSDKILGILNTDEIIKFSKEIVLPNLPDELFWADGSGLSRYNLMTPRTIVEVLRRLYVEQPLERLIDLFPAGGLSGTIRARYKNATGVPYIFAKTGTVRNNHCMSGYLLTERGKVLIFSFMHNNFPDGPGVLKAEMEKILGYVRENA